MFDIHQLPISHHRFYFQKLHTLCFEIFFNLFYSKFCLQFLSRSCLSKLSIIQFSNLWLILSLRPISCSGWSGWEKYFYSLLSWSWSDISKNLKWSFCVDVASIPTCTELCWGSGPGTKHWQMIHLFGSIQPGNCNAVLYIISTPSYLNICLLL